MKFFTELVAATALALATTLAQTPVHAQVPSSGALRVSDFDGPYGYGAPEASPPRAYGYGYGYERGPAPSLLPPEEVYAVLRENGFSPLGIPHLRGTVYTIAAIDRRGDDGRLVIDARDGRILRFMPAYGQGYGQGFGMGPVYEEGAVAPYGSQGALPPPTVIRGGPPRPPASIPHVASRSVPLPRAAPPRGEVPVAAAKPEVAPQAHAPQSAAAAPQPVPTVGQAKPAPTILPTQDMPPAQGLE